MLKLNHFFSNRLGGIFIVIFFLFSFTISFSQTETLTNSRCKWIKKENYFNITDSLSIIPGTIIIKSIIDTSQIKINFYPSQNIVSINFFKILPPDSLFICFRVFPYSFHKRNFRKDPGIIDSLGEMLYNPYIQKNKNDYKEELFSTPGINKSGSISRGVSIGNNQDMFVNSSFNLQLNGKLSEQLKIKAAITDENIPIQPEGNTQEIQDFDRIYMEIEHEKGAKLTAGDIILKNPESNFLRYYKNAKGGLFEYEPVNLDTFRFNSSISGAISKGKYTSQKINITEGIQGPYRLRGENNEKFIVIIAGSEKIWLDGKLLTRGFDKDYTMDYNSAELVFSNKILLTKYSRVSADYEYSDKNYSRTLFTAGHNQTIGKLNLKTNFFNESDNPNRPLTQKLEPNEIEKMKEVGDSLSFAYLPGFDTVTFDANKILYKRIDTTVNNILYSIFVYSVHPDSAIYQLQMNEVGYGRGNYLQKKTLANGRVFAWIAPVNGIPQGNYEPLRFLITPKMGQMATLGADYKFSDKNSIFIESAFSKKDINRFSGLNSDDDRGNAYIAGYKNSGSSPFWIKSFSFLDEYEMGYSLTYRKMEKNFSPVDRFDDVEFERDWGNPQNSDKVDDEQVSVGVDLNKNPSNLYTYQLSRRTREKFLNAVQQKLGMYQSIGKLNLRADLFNLDNKNLNNDNLWSRYNLETFFKYPYFRPGLIYNFDNNTIFPKIRRDSLLTSSIKYTERGGYITNDDSLKLNYNIKYTERDNFKPFTGKYRLSDLSKTLQSGVRSGNLENHTFELNSIYYEHKFKDSLLKDADEFNLQNQLSWNGTLIKKILSGGILYQTGTGRELRKEFAFLEVPAGEGTHIYLTDRNQNGIKEIDEFETAVYATEANYIKVVLPSDQYQKVFSNSFNYTTNINSPLLWKKEKGFKKFISRFSDISSMNLEKKFITSSVNARLNPFYKIPDSNLVNHSRNLRNVLYFNRSNPDYGLDFGYSTYEQKNLVLNGFDLRDFTEYSLTQRFSFLKVADNKTIVKHAEKNNISDYSSYKNYRLKNISLKNEIGLFITESFRIVVIGGYKTKNNRIGKPVQEKADFIESGAEFRISKALSRSIEGGLKWIKIKYNADPGSSLAYEILEGLDPGNNYTWQLTVQQKLANGLNISLNYEGRKPADNPFVHTGRFQVSAVF